MVCHIRAVGLRRLRTATFTFLQISITVYTFRMRSILWQTIQLVWVTQLLLLEPLRAIDFLAWPRRPLSMVVGGSVVFRSKG